MESTLILERFQGQLSVAVAVGIANELHQIPAIAARPHSGLVVLINHGLKAIAPLPFWWLRFDPTWHKGGRLTFL